MKRLLVAAAFAAVCWTAAEALPDAKPRPKPVGMTAKCPKPTYSVAAENEVWLITNLVDDGTRTTISYRIATIEPDGRVVATRRKGTFCVGSARAAANADYLISELNGNVEELERQVRNKADRPPPKLSEEAKGRNDEERDRLLKIQEQLRKARDARAAKEAAPPAK